MDAKDYKLSQKQHNTMKLISKIVALVISLGAVAEAQTPFKLDNDNTLILDGHVEAIWGSDNPAINPDSFHFGEIFTNIRPILKIDSKTWIAEFEVNMSHVGIENSNWLLRAAIGYKITPDISILVGRIMTADIFLTPAGRYNPLVRCPRVPTGVYGWGVQMNAKVNNHLSVMWDITTDTSKSFQDEDTFDGLETSLRATYKFDDQWSLAGNISYDFRNHDSLVGLDAEYKSGPWSIRFVGYGKWDDHPRDTYGAYLIATYLVNSHLEIHGGLDAQHEHGFSQTVGLRFFFTDDKKTDLRVDYIHSDGFGPDEHTLAIGLRKRF